MMKIQEIQQALDILYSQGKSEEAYQYMMEQLPQAITQGRDDIILFLLSELMGYYRVTSQFEAGNNIAIQAIKILTNHGLENTIHAATTYLNIATLYRVQGQYQNSLMMYKKCEDIYSMYLEEKDERYASFYNNLSLLYQEMGEYNQAIDYELKALSIIETLKDCEIEEAITYTNLSSMYKFIHKKEQAIKCLNKAIALFKIFGKNDPHYFAAMALKAEYYYDEKQYVDAIKLYDEVLDGIENAYGKSKEYYIVHSNRDRVIEEYKNTHIKGIDLCYQYYQKYGKKMLEDFKEYRQYMAIGLFGYGSECLGFDDHISTDHDFGPGFIILLPHNVYQIIGQSLQQAYDNLPEEYLGIKRKISNHGVGRVGVFSIEQYFGRFIKRLPQNLEEWLYIDENALLNCTNGCIFEDNFKEVTRIREILKYYPEDIRIKKITEAIAKMAQSGQYNYGRCMKRKDVVAASLALHEFIDYSLSCIYLLNRKYKPYYKWSFKGLENLEKLSDIKPLLEELVLLPAQEEAWEDNVQGINYNDKKIVIIEKICQKIITELTLQGLTKSTDDFLENHTQEVISYIKDDYIRNM